VRIIENTYINTPCGKNAGGIYNYHYVEGHTVSTSLPLQMALRMHKMCNARLPRRGTMTGRTNAESVTVSEETGNPDFFQATEETREVTRRELNTVTLLKKCCRTAIRGYWRQRLKG